MRAARHKTEPCLKSLNSTWFNPLGFWSCLRGGLGQADLAAEFR